MHRHFVARHRLDLLFSPWVVGSVALIAELMQMGIILLVARPYDDAIHLIENIIAPCWWPIPWGPPCSCG